MVEPWKKAVVVFSGKKRKEQEILEKPKPKNPDIDTIVEWENKKREVACVTLLCWNCTRFLKKVEDNLFQCPSCGTKFKIVEDVK